MGRRVEQRPELYNAENFRAWTDRSRRNLGVDTLDLVQLHCPPTAVYESDEVFDALDALVDDGTIAAYGVSVEETAQALTAIARPGVASVQIILNAFRLKPLDAVLPGGSGCRGRHHRARPARERTAHRPVHATTRSSRRTTTAVQPARRVVRRGGDVLGRRLRRGSRGGARVRGARRAAWASTPATAALAWITQQPGVTTVIPGARNVAQAVANAAAASVPPLGRGVRGRRAGALRPPLPRGDPRALVDASRARAPRGSPPGSARGRSRAAAPTARCSPARRRA